MEKLFAPYQKGSLSLKNRIVMAPMTRCRCIDNVPGELVAQYYGQRTEAGLIVTEGTAPSPAGLGYARIPGIFNDAQVAGWQKVTQAVHRNNTRIFVQLMHTGRVGHPLNLPKGEVVKGPSPIPLAGDMYTDAEGLQPYPVPEEMTVTEIRSAIEAFADAAERAINEAGFDGVELHGANGYLIDQFLNTASNQRTDEWGGSIENRARFAIETAKAVAKRIGPEKTGMRLSPYGVASGMKPDPAMGDLYLYLTNELAALNLVYLHVVDHSAMGAPKPDEKVISEMRKRFPNSFILSGGFDGSNAEGALTSDKGDLIAFGRPFIANAKLATALKNRIQLAQPNFDLLYTPGKEGYIDYPEVAQSA